MKLVIKNKKFRLPRFRLPKVRTDFGFPTIDIAIPRVVSKISVGGHFKKMAGVSISIAGLVVVIAIAFAAVGVEQAITFPTAAEYTVGSQDKVVGIGQDLGNSPETQTLKLNIGGARIKGIIIDDLEVGSSAVSESLKITTGSTSIWLECDEVIIDNLVAPSLTIKNSEIYSLTVNDNKADGNSFSPTLANGIKDITVASTRGAVDMPSITKSDYDRIWIDVTGTSAQCAQLHIKNVSAYGAPVVLDQIKAGSLIIKNSTIGDGDGIDSADFVLESTVKISTSSLTNNTEVPISVK